MTSMEMTDKDLPGDLEIQLKLKKRSTQELVEFQKKLKYGRYNNNPQAMAIRFHIVRELLIRHAMREDVFSSAVMGDK